jgi:hypothetical protein
LAEVDVLKNPAERFIERTLEVAVKGRDVRPRLVVLSFDFDLVSLRHWLLAPSLLRPSDPFDESLVPCETPAAHEPAWLAKKLSERGLSTDAVNRLLTGLRQIDSPFPERVNDEGQIQGFKATDKNASLANVLPKFSEFERLLAELLQEIERRAAETA